MHPILFRIPLPKMPLMLWWAFAAAGAIAVVYLLLGLRKKDRGTIVGSLVVAAGCGVLGYVFRETKFEAANLPIYSYGVMLGLSLVVGWYLTLTLAERDGLPKETMANCYVITAVAAIAGSRILYILTNIDEFRVNPHDTSSAMDFASFFALRRGGLVAYGGFLGGYIGSWLYLRAHRIRLMPWADVAVPSLASGLLITRIGCYLFGCDFGKRLPENAPGFLARMGTFPHWDKGTLEGGDGSPAWVKHLSSFQGAKLEELKSLNHSFPVHPTQIYESLVGLLLLGLLLWQRKNQKFRGQIFFLFAFAYGYLRFIIEFLRDDTERGEIGTFSLHWFVGISLLLFALAFTFGISLGITNPKLRNGARVLSFVPAVAAFAWLMPAKYAETVSYHPSTSQWIGLLSAIVVAFFYASFWETARRSPKLAMGLESLGDIEPSGDDGGPRRKNRDDDEEDDGDEVVAADEDRPVRRKKKKGLAKPAATAAAAEDDADDTTSDDEPEATPAPPAGDTKKDEPTESA